MKTTATTLPAIDPTGLTNGYCVAHEHHENECVFVDNPAVAHRAAPEAHMPAAQQGLRIMRHGTVKGVQDHAPAFGLPLHVTIDGPDPVGEGVWQRGGVGFRRHPDAELTSHWRAPRSTGARRTRRGRPGSAPRGPIPADRRPATCQDP